MQNDEREREPQSPQPEAGDDADDQRSAEEFETVPPGAVNPEPESATGRLAGRRADPGRRGPCALRVRGARRRAGRRTAAQRGGGLRQTRDLRAGRPVHHGRAFRSGHARRSGRAPSARAAAPRTGRESRSAAAAGSGSWRPAWRPRCSAPALRRAPSSVRAAARTTALGWPSARTAERTCVSRRLPRPASFHHRRRHRPKVCPRRGVRLRAAARCWGQLSSSWPLRA